MFKNRFFVLFICLYLKWLNKNIFFCLLKFELKEKKKASVFFHLLIIISNNFKFYVK